MRGVVGLHASFTVSDDTIARAGALCREMGTVLHVHMAEDRADVDDARARGYAGPLERLESLGALPPGSILAHGVHLDGAQVRHAGARGWWIVQNPRSNRHNGVGYPAGLAESPLVALGTDGFVSDMNQEAAALREDALAHGESPEVAARRVSDRRSNWPVERFDGPLPAGARPDLQPIHDAIEQVRMEAAAAASALWERMASL